jgi:hypothetical protein
VIADCQRRIPIRGTGGASKTCCDAWEKRRSEPASERPSFRHRIGLDDGNLTDPYRLRNEARMRVVSRVDLVALIEAERPAHAASRGVCLAPVEIRGFLTTRARGERPAVHRLAGVRLARRIWRDG